MTTVVRSVGYTNSLQRLTWTYGASTILAYLWGGGGGGGGDEGSDDPGGNGGGGSWALCQFTVNPGDIITVAVGQGGGGGRRTPGSQPGAGGRSLTYNVFNTRDYVGIDVVAVTDPRWNYFMNAHAVWDPGGSGVTPVFRSYTVNFPVTGYYLFQYSADDGMTVDLDGSEVFSYGGFRADPVPFVSRLVTAGNHTLNISANNSGGDVAGFALTIDISFSGALGGTGYPGSNGGGSGGGGGGATVLMRNNVILAIAGGGGGGGGAGGNGNTLGTSGPNAYYPGDWGYTTVSNATVAQDGQGSVSGGGGGGGGGGQRAGNGGRRGGASPSNPDGGADYDGTAGSPGETVGPSGYSLPVGRTPGGGPSAEKYFGGWSYGGYGGSQWVSGDGQNGLNGAAVFEMDVSQGLYVRDENLWKPLSEVYVKDSGSWKQIKNLYVKDQNTWKSVFSTDPPIFRRDLSGGFGQTSRRRGQG